MSVLRGCTNAGNFKTPNLIKQRVKVQIQSSSVAEQSHILGEMYFFHIMSIIFVLQV